MLTAMMAETISTANTEMTARNGPIFCSQVGIAGMSIVSILALRRRARPARTRASNPQRYESTLSCVISFAAWSTVVPPPAQDEAGRRPPPSGDSCTASVTLLTPLWYVAVRDARVDR